jgi:hypothetical protein
MMAGLSHPGREGALFQRCRETGIVNSGDTLSTYASQNVARYVPDAPAVKVFM